MGATDPEATPGEAADDELEPFPFVRMNVTRRFTAIVEAGYATEEEVVELAIDTEVPLPEAAGIYNEAYNWCLSRWQELLQPAPGEGPQGIDGDLEALRALEALEEELAETGDDELRERLTEIRSGLVGAVMDDGPAGR